MKALVLTPSSLFKLSQFSISNEWFADYHLPLDTAGLKRVVVDNIAFLIEINIDTDEGSIVVIDLQGDHPVFSAAEDNVAVLERIITVARSVFTTSVAIPTGWRAHREGHLLSIAATPGENWRARLHFDQYPNHAKDLLVFGRTEQSIDFSKLTIPLGTHAQARKSFTDAVLATPPAPVKQSKDSSAGIILSQRLPQGFVQGASLQQWYKSKLTTEQRQFVDKPHDGPVRLRGSAGTGKTLSLVIKFLRDGLLAEETKREVRFGFLTHSLASVDLVSAIAESLDTAGLMFGLGKYCKLEVRTLYDLAAEHLLFNFDNLQPLSLDGREGRRLQSEIITSVLKEMAASPILPLQYEDITSSIKDKWLAVSAGHDLRFVSEVMNEFASVLDAEGIRAGQELGEKYAKSSSQRPAWLIPLPSEIDRRFMLECHRRYRKILGEMHTLSVDQMVADFNSFLDSNRWDRTRSRAGYDVLFVDELHLFTFIERQSLHKLIKLSADEQGRPKRPPIFMAYDLKQSPRDSFTSFGDGSNSLFSITTGLQNSALVQLDKVFRYTPQIAEFLADLDATFPAIDIPEEWDAYVGQAQLSDGATPELTLFKDDVTLFRNVFDEAHRCARLAEGGGRRVAVLCASEEMFDIYLKAAIGQYKGKILPIISREPSSELRHAGKRFLFSMPEYVAGLQFDTVFLIHVNAKEAPVDAAMGVRRRFISTIYLGSSRAEKRLCLSASVIRGGESDILTMALERKSLRRTQPK